MSFAQGEPLVFGDRAAWRSWLKKNHARAQGSWVVIAKKKAVGLHYEEAVEEALCYGWIDSIVRRRDDDSYRQWYSPRKPGSTWSKSNKQRVERLIREGRMCKAGMASVELAKKNGSWEHLTEVEEMVVPADLKKALAADRMALRNFEKMSPSHRKQYLYWINEAKRPDTRERRIKEAVRLAAAGKKSRTE